MAVKQGLLLLVAPLAVFVMLRAGSGTYPRGELLVESGQLARRHIARDYVVLDVRERSKYDRGHVPQVRWVDRAVWVAAFGHGQDAESWSKRIGALGIGADSRAIVYDDNFNLDAAFVWWVLRYWGVADVRVLNGGWTGWTAGAHPIDRDRNPPTECDFVARANAGRIATKELLLQSPHRDLQIVDARSRKEFLGAEKRDNQRAGAIPGAKQLEWIDVIERPTQRFQTAAELRRQFDRAGIDLDRPTAAYCQCGVRSAVLAFALELMGARDVSNYLPGWTEWGNAADTPVVVDDVNDPNYTPRATN